MNIIEKKMLPAFLTRGGMEPRFSADFEQDGVTVDLFGDASDL